MEQANLNIGTIGQKLEAARHAKGVTVSEAGHATKILSKFIEAMEADDFGALSAPVYAKSFIRMYAQYLSLDARPLVDEYIAKHAPKSKNQLNEDVRQKLAETDQMPTEQNGAVAVAAPNAGRKIFGNVNEAITRMSGSGMPFKIVLPALGGILLLTMIIFSATQCTEDEEQEPSAVGGAASVQHQAITDQIPDTYLGTSGEIDVDR